MICKLTPEEEVRMHILLKGIADDPNALEMQKFIQHGSVTTYEHCMRVTRIARYNAEVVFALTDKEKDIIQSHMWPLTPTDIPHSREAALVCMADKMSSSYETVLERRAKRKNK